MWLQHSSPSTLGILEFLGCVLCICVFVFLCVFAFVCLCLAVSDAWSRQRVASPCLWVVTNTHSRLLRTPICPTHMLISVCLSPILHLGASCSISNNFLTLCVCVCVRSMRYSQFDLLCLVAFKLPKVQSPLFQYNLWSRRTGLRGSVACVAELDQSQTPVHTTQIANNNNNGYCNDNTNIKTITIATATYIPRILLGQSSIRAILMLGSI